MSIFGFVREAKKNKIVLKDDLVIEEEPAVSPFDHEPDTPEDLEKMLARTFEKALTEDYPFADEDRGFGYTLHTLQTIDLSLLAATYDVDVNDIVAINGGNKTWFVGQILCIPTSEIILEMD